MADEKHVDMDNKILYFKTLPSIFKEEKSDVKNNTSRYISDSTDKRYIVLRYLAINPLEVPLWKVCITKAVENKDPSVINDFFVRSIRNVCYYDGRFIVTWSPLC